MLKVPKLCEFNYKILHNILPCGKILSKWQKDISNKCQVCNKLESAKHMLYECQRVYEIWNNVSCILGINIRWKHIVCGFPKYVDIGIKIVCIVTILLQ